MSAKQNRILIFGAGVIGSMYAIKLIEAGFDVTLFAHSNRFKSLRENGLQYKEKSTVRSIQVNVIDTLEKDDVYDFIFVTVRYDRSESALLALKDNQSKNIVTMTSNSIGFSSWLDIVGDRLLPAFPGFGGQIKDGVLHARFLPKIIVATAFGEINGVVTERIENLAKLFKTAKLPYVIKKDMQAYLITHSVSDIAMMSVLYSENKIIDKKTAGTRKTARKITVTFKAYLRAIQKARVSIDPPMLKMVHKFPNLFLDLFFMTWLRTKMVRDMMLPDYANNANNEIMQLSNDLMKFLSQNDIKSESLTKLTGNEN
ncbi:2-dehydropantoate 2-reductase N-terminal domain-containing protein [Paenibacillus dokdonensis]|uniref:2-dehydropantoate 2-reductase N-terminal domain-containing protein n=1 Tax=Paenibacillus dokdonensis TaxID=2567944 RepID=A0ABU6GJD6_9BACL|nr:2-dehydropantoate 2-reductase N-terminal domain-containing protein [Paenibacillus dokdonensis]MEC0239852.1 2-dehydropantoate 2-reductase N-terminal domain-containing protein [Paenibacillus dokdonensis]